VPDLSLSKRFQTRCLSLISHATNGASFGTCAAHVGRSFVVTGFPVFMPIEDRRTGTFKYGDSISAKSGGCLKLNALARG